MSYSLEIRREALRLLVEWGPRQAVEVSGYRRADGTVVEGYRRCPRESCAERPFAAVRNILREQFGVAQLNEQTIRNWAKEARLFRRERSRLPWSLSQRVGHRIWPAEIQQRALTLLSGGLSSRKVRDQIRLENGYGPSHETILTWSKVAALPTDERLAAHLHSDAAVVTFVQAGAVDSPQKVRAAILRLFFEEKVYAVAAIAARLKIPPPFVAHVLNEEQREEAS